MFDRRMFVRVLKDSGLSKREMAKMLGVSHGTIYSWMKTRAPGQAHLLAFVDRAMRATQAAIKAGLLPLSQRLSREERARRVASMAAVLQRR